MPRSPSFLPLPLGFSLSLPHRLILVAAGLALAMGAEARTLETADGSVEVPESPERIVTLLIRWVPQGPMVMSDQPFTSGLIEAAGLAIGDAGLVRDGGVHSDTLSLENLSRLDGDWLFLATLNEEGQEALHAARNSPAFARLPAVQADRVIPVDGQLWTSATGPLAAQAILEELETAPFTLMVGLAIGLAAPRVPPCRCTAWRPRPCTWPTAARR